MEQQIKAVENIINDSQNRFMIFSISGAQGSGKSTIFNSFEDLYNSGTNRYLNSIVDTFGEFHFVKRKTARTIRKQIMTENRLRDFDEAFRDKDIIVDFQNRVLEAKIHDDIIEPHSNGYRIVITERAPLELATYTLSHLGFYQEYSDYINGYIDMASTAGELYHSMILTSGHFRPENDGVRPINEHYQRMIDSTIRDLTNRYTSNYWHICDSIAIESRVEEFTKMLVDVTGIKFI